MFFWSYLSPNDNSERKHCLFSESCVSFRRVDERGRRHSLCVALKKKTFEHSAVAAFATSNLKVPVTFQLLMMLANIKVAPNNNGRSCNDDYYDSRYRESKKYSQRKSDSL